MWWRRPWPPLRMVGRTLRNMHFRDRYGFTALAIWRQGEVITERLRDVRLRFGDALLLKGPRHRLPALQQGDDFLVLEPVMLEMRRRRKAWIAVGIMALVLFLVTVVRAAHRHGHGHRRGADGPERLPDHGRSLPEHRVAQRLSDRRHAAPGHWPWRPPARPAFWPTCSSACWATWGRWPSWPASMSWPA
jgi:hypothetical protein